MNSRFQALTEKGKHIRSQMWKTHLRKLSKREKALFACLRVATITWQGIVDNRLFNRAAALSFSSMLAFAPVIVLMVLVAGFAMNQAGVDTVIQKLDDAIEFIAPQLENLEAVNEREANQAQLAESENIQKIEDMLSSFIEKSQSGSVGIVGAMVLILIVIQLFSTIEGAFNDIWRVQRGRSWATKVGLYWTVITLGAVLAFAGLAILTTELATISNNLLESYNFLEMWITIAVKATSFTMIICILAVFYRFIPNTLVTWKAGFVGATFAVTCIVLNNEMAFFYLERVVLFKSLYGPLSLIPVMMLGMFVFWLIILSGGQVTYAVQNARYKSEKIVWDELSLASRESLCLLLFARISRSFKDCKEAPSAGELASVADQPIQLVNSALSMLCDMGLVSASPPEDNGAYQFFRYQPAKPLDRISLVEFKKSFENLGNQPNETLFDHHDPVVKRFHEQMNEGLANSFGDLTVQSLLDQLATEQTDPTNKKVEPISEGKFA